MSHLPVSLFHLVVDYFLMILRYSADVLQSHDSISKQKTHEIYQQLHAALPSQCIQRRDKENN